MSRDLLTTWLNLPATPWPPNDYALLGLELGQGTTDEIEQRVLERMDKLRHHQLRHPDQVTEGMNLLAQAHNRLTDPAARRTYDREHGLRPAEPAPPEIVPAAADSIPVVEVIEIPSLPRQPSRPARVVEPVPPPSTAGPVPPPTAKEFIYPREEDRTDENEAVPEPIIPELIEPEPPLEPEDADRAEDDDAAPEDVWELPARPDTEDEEEEDPRRKIYADLVRIRRVLRIWEKLRVFLDEPEKAFSRRTETVAFMSCLADLRPLLATVSDLVGGPNQPGNFVAILSRQQLVVEMFRSLLPSQRDKLAEDCQKAHYLLVERYNSLREEARSLNVKGFSRRVWRPMIRHVISRPEWLFLVLGVLALLIAFIRSMPR